MTENAYVPELERISFFPGQRLTATDLTAAQRAQRELRWLHNRALHAWGIGAGLGVTGQRGDRAVTVEPGFGIDDLGREILLGEPRTISIPAVASGPQGDDAVYFLVVAYVGDEDQRVAERRPGICLPEGSVRLGDEPALAWRKPGTIEEGREIVLAEVRVRNCELSLPVSLTPRRAVRASQQPYLAGGQTPRGSTDWHTWDVSGQRIGVATQVATSEARFRTTPRYVAHVAGDRFLAVAPGPLLVAGFTGVTDATPEGFTLWVQLPALPPAQVPVNPPELSQLDPAALREIFTARLGWHVVWMGIEG